MKMDLEVYLGGGLGCKSEECAYRGECSSHETAGQFRGEGGFTPEVELLSDGTFVCHTADRPADPCRAAEYGQDLPDNHRDLGCGRLTVLRLRADSCINYAI